MNLSRHKAGRLAEPPAGQGAAPAAAERLMRTLGRRGGRRPMQRGLLDLIDPAFDEVDADLDDLARQAAHGRIGGGEAGLP